MVVLFAFLSACSNFNLLRNQELAGPGTTINGNRVKANVKTPPVPQRRTDTGLIQAAERENTRIVAAYGGVYSNRGVEDQLSRIVSRLINASDVPSQAFQITILNSPSVNAFALPGGFLYITRGLLALASDASEVAAVLAHEMAHVTSNHGQERLRKARKAELVSRAVRNVVRNEEAAAFVLAKRQLDFAAFTQQQEFAADAIGVRNSGRAGYDPFAAARFLETMAAYQSYRSSASVALKEDGPDFLSSHPSTPERVAQARLAARQIGAPGIGKNERTAYLRSIDGMIFGDDPEEGYVRDRSFFHPQLRFTFSVPQGYVIDNTPEAVLATAANGDAIRFDGVQVANNVSLPDYLQSGWLNGLDPASITQFTVNGSPAASAVASVAEWSFKITVIRAPTSTYRMIFATKNPSTRFDRSVSATVSSFRTLSEREARNLSPLRIKVMKVGRQDTVFSLSRPMRGLVANPDEAFRVFNGLSRRQQPEAGDFVKVIVDGASG
ncbi:MAG: M48 family metalloprotease [Pseudomonadota bacterium]